MAVQRDKGWLQNLTPKVIGNINAQVMTSDVTMDPDEPVNRRRDSTIIRL